MNPGPGNLTGYLQPLLRALREPASCRDLDESGWDRLIPLARNARLLGVLAKRVAASADLDALPPRAQRHLRAGLIEARFRRQKTLHLLHTIAPLLQGHPGPWVLLKGAAYIALDLPLAQGRMPGDVDLMVPRAALDGIEQALLRAGWAYEKTDPYDQHYYRAWSHELPPMRAAGQALELDLHHTILPPTGRIRPDTPALFADAQPLPGLPYHVLAPDDRILHAAAHLAQDSDFVDRLRDLIDLDALLRAFDPCDPQRLDALTGRARQHGMTRPLWIAATLCARWLGTPGCAALAEALRAGQPMLATGAWVVHAATRVLGPPDPAGDGTPRHRLARALLTLRAHWLRMPPWLLAYHAAAKSARSAAVSLAARRAARRADG